MSLSIGTFTNHPIHRPPSFREGLARLTEPFSLTSGAKVPNLELAYTLSGPENAPVIAILGGISADRNPAATLINPGWWPKIAGPGKVLDTNRYRILSFDYLGGFGMSTGQDVLTNHSAKPFHPVSTYDQASALAAVLGFAGVQALEMLVGASYGGMVALAFSARFPQLAKRQIVICAGDRSLPQAIAWREIQRRIAVLGLENGCPGPALELARQLAVLTFRTPLELNTRFQAGLTDPNDPKSIIGYLSHQGRKFAARRKLREFLCLSHSIDNHRVDAGAIRTQTHLIGSATDQLVTVQQLRDLQSQFGGPCSLHIIDSLFGHDAFLKEPGQMTDILRKIISSRDRNDSRPLPSVKKRRAP